MRKNTILLNILGIVSAFLICFTFQFGVVQADSSTQTEEDCQECHSQAVEPWSQSRHQEGNVSCLVCHKLQEGEGEHPSKNYSVEPEELTCMVCHTSVASMGVTDQLKLSAHGQVGLTCVSCHEPHSQGPVLAPGSTLVCENCHKNTSKDLAGSTHHVVGLSCVNCHMGPEKDHSQMIKGETCGACHDDLHASNALLTAGIEVEAKATPMAITENVTPASDEEPVETQGAGVTLPGWLLLLAGLLAGGIISWTIFAREPGEPTK